MDNIFVRGPRVTPLPGGSKTNWAVGAKPKLADELKTELDAGKILIIDVRAPEQF
ncbi:MAG: hypothetical protein ACXWYD_16590 [Candidatus Binatia bacterium]